MARKTGAAWCGRRADLPVGSVQAAGHFPQSQNVEFSSIWYKKTLVHDTQLGHVPVRKLNLWLSLLLVHVPKGTHLEDISLGGT